jgi:hypothetical protein
VSRWEDLFIDNFEFTIDIHSEVLSMKTAEIKKQIIKDLGGLPVELQKRVQEFTHALLVTQPKGTPGKDLLRFSGLIDKGDLDKMKSAIESGCERVDSNEW